MHRAFRLGSIAASLGLVSCGEVGEAAQAPSVGLSSSAIVGGTAAPQDAYSWFAYTYLEVEGERYELCGGMLVDATHVITAAHCTIRHELDEEKHQFTEQLRPAAAFFVAMRPQALSDVTDDDLIAVKQVSVPPGYADDISGIVGDAGDQDVAVFTLERPVHLDKYPRIASARELAQLTKQHARVRTIGFGYTDPNGDELSEVLNQVDVKLVSNETCAKQYEGVAPITDAMLCAGWRAGGRDSCAGDSGGPIFYRRESGEELLLGVVSWGTEVLRDPDIVPCGSADYASVYTNLVSLHDYIHDCLEGCCASLTSKVVCADGYADADGSEANGCEKALPQPDGALTRGRKHSDS